MNEVSPSGFSPAPHQPWGGMWQAVGAAGPASIAHADFDAGPDGHANRHVHIHANANPHSHIDTDYNANADRHQHTGS